MAMRKNPSWISNFLMLSWIRSLYFILYIKFSWPIFVLFRRWRYYNIQGEWLIRFFFIFLSSEDDWDFLPWNNERDKVRFALLTSSIVIVQILKLQLHLRACGEKLEDILCNNSTVAVLYIWFYSRRAKHVAMATIANKLWYCPYSLLLINIYSVNVSNTKLDSDSERENKEVSVCFITKRSILWTYYRHTNWGITYKFDQNL